MTAFTTQQRNARRWALSAWAVLIAVVCLQQLQQGLTLHHAGFALLYSLPLLAPLRGMLRGDRYTYQWATLCVLPYFIVGVTESVANSALRVWALQILGLSLLWFFALLAYVRVTPRTTPAE